MTKSTVLDCLTAPEATPEILRVRAAYWATVADRNARAGRIDQARRLRVNCRAMRRQAADLERPVTPVVSAALASPRRVPAVRRRELGAERFWAACAAAVDAIRARYGDNWKIHAPVGETVVATVPGKLRSYRTARGTVIRFRADHRLPAAKYWPDGSIPGDLAFVPDYPRETRNSPWGPGTCFETYAAWQSDWARRNGLVQVGAAWITVAEAAQRELAEATRNAERPDLDCDLLETPEEEIAMPVPSCQVIAFRPRLAESETVA